MTWYMVYDTVHKTKTLIGPNPNFLNIMNIVTKFGGLGVIEVVDFKKLYQKDVRALDGMLPTKYWFLIGQNRNFQNIMNFVTKLIGQGVIEVVGFKKLHWEDVRALDGVGSDQISDIL